MEGQVTGVFRNSEQATAAVEQLRSIGIGADAVQIEEKKGGLLEALLPSEERSDETYVSVRAGDRIQQVRQLLRQNGASKIEDDGAARAGDGDGETLELATEELRPQITTMQVGEVIVRKVVVTEIRTLEVPIRREEIVIERSILNEPLAAPAGNRFEQTTESGEVENAALGADEEVIRVPILEEQVIVEKHPIVREEVRIVKRRIREVVNITEQIRREEPVLDQEAGDEPRQYQ